MPSPDNKYFRHLLKVWRANARAAVIREMEFRTNFFSGISRQIMWLASFILLIEVIYANTESLAGWNKIQVITLLALSRFIEGISDTMFNRNIGKIPEEIQSGKFDFHLVKPVPAQFLAAFHRFRFLDLGNAVLGLFLLAYAFTLNPDAFTLTNTLLFIFLTFLGITIYYGIMITIASLAFFLEKLDAFVAITNLISEPLTVPFDIFPAGLKTALTYLLPLAFVVFVPAEALTGRLELTQIPIAIIMTILILLIANLIWSAGLKKYSSASA